MGVGKKTATTIRHQPPRETTAETPPGTPDEEEILPGVTLPIIRDDDNFVQAVKSLSAYFVDEIHLPSTFEQLRTTAAGNKIRYLVEHLVRTVKNPVIINALLTLKWHFSTLEADDRGINETRANACEIVAWRFLSRISERDAVDYCLFELPSAKGDTTRDLDGANETSSLLPQFRAPERSPTRPVSKIELLRTVSSTRGMFGDAEVDGVQDDDEEDPTSSFTGLNGLEIAAVADCKRFLSQRIVQKIVHGIWIGDICFWESLSATTEKKTHFYNKRRPDPFTRLRVPRYIKAFEVLFFVLFLFLYYAVLVERNPYRITAIEVMLYIWFAAFAYDELSEFKDAGSIFYSVDIWNGCDLVIILIGAAYVITRIVGIVKDRNDIIDISFDILALEALFMVPRICSLLSLHPYFGTLIPCLKAMAKDFVKFMVVVAVLYIGFLTTFTLLARDMFSLAEMSWILIKVFFGSSYLGFDIMNDINPHLGPPLMLIFVCMTNILLITSLISILGDSFSKVIRHAREEYLYIYSVYVLEASTSNRLIHFYPPLNLIPLILIRPLRLFMSAESLRTTRIAVLKATHLPIVGAIWVFERVHDHVRGNPIAFSSMGPSTQLDRDRTIKKQSPFLTKSTRTNTKRLSQQFNAPSEDGSRTPIPQAPVRINTTGTPGSDNPNLEKMVEDLSTKIAELTALVMAQQGSAPEDSL